MKYAVKLPTKFEISKIESECKLGNVEGRLNILFVINTTLDYVKSINSGYKEWPMWANWATMDQDKIWCLWKLKPKPNINRGMWEIDDAELRKDYVVVRDEVLEEALIAMRERLHLVRWQRCVLDKELIASSFPLMESSVYDT